MTHVQTIQIDELRPNVGPGEGDEPVEIIGSGLILADQVYFGTQAAEFDEDSDSRLIVYPPAGNGDVEVYVIDQKGNQSNSLPYRYAD